MIIKRFFNKIIKILLHRIETRKNRLYVKHISNLTLPEILEMSTNNPDGTIIRFSDDGVFVIKNGKIIKEYVYKLREHKDR